MTERKVLTIEYTEQEALALLELARWGDDARRIFTLQMPEETTQLAAETAIMKLIRGIAVESGPGGNFVALHGRVYQAEMQRASR